MNRYWSQSVRDQWCINNLYSLIYIEHNLKVNHLINVDNKLRIHWSSFFFLKFFFFWKINLRMPFTCTRYTVIQTFQCKIIQRTFAFNEWLKTFKIKEENNCSFCNYVNSIPHFLIDCTSYKVIRFFWEMLGINDLF